jgi:hypothetical protein
MTESTAQEASYVLQPHLVAYQFKQLKMPKTKKNIWWLRKP